MPTYDYKCDACGHAFEKFESITAKPGKKCPECGKSKLKRLFGTGAGLIFKGSGFYITDYRDKAYTDKAKADTGATGGSSENKSETKSESKPESKTESKAEPKSESKPAESKPKAESKPAKAEKSHKPHKK